MYTEKSMYLLPKKATGADTKVDLASAAVAPLSYVVLSQCKVRRIAVAISTATVSTGNIVVKAKQYPIVGSSSNAVVVGTLNIPPATAAGSVVYLDIAGVVLSPGQELVCEVTTAAAGGGAAGVGYFGIEADLDPELAANQSKMILSA